jgi:ATP-binding cassette subfamily G (WHITE) protein 2 (PDR)
MFDRLLFLHEGKSVYFGELGPGSRTLIDYFENNGARKCGSDDNPAEWLLETIENTGVSWTEKWENSSERKQVRKEIQSMKQDMSRSDTGLSTEKSSEFATSFSHQLYTVTLRNFERDWRTPSYIYSKIFLTLGAVCNHILYAMNKH